MEIFLNELSSEQFLTVSKLNPEERFDYAIAKMIELKHLWGLYGSNGWLLLKAEDDSCLPIWPHESFATAWLKDEFPDCKPKQIEFDEWLNQWLPGMQKNGTLTLVFPFSDDEEGVMLTAEEILECIREDMQELEE
jgi:hypothetical protein